MSQDLRIADLFDETKSKYDNANDTKRKLWGKLQDAMDMKHSKKYLFHYFLGTYADLLYDIWVSGMFKDKNFFNLVSLAGNSDNEVVEQLLVAEKRMKSQMKKARLIPKLKMLLQSMSYLGSRVGKVSWDSILNGPNFEGVGNNDVGVDPTRDFHQQNIKLIRQEVDWGDLVIMQGQGFIQDIQNIKSVFYPVPKTGKDMDDKKYENRNIDKADLDVAGKDTGGRKCIYQMWIKQAVLRKPPNPEDIEAPEEYDIITDKCYLIEPTTKEILSVSPHDSDYAVRTEYRDPYVIGRSNPQEGLCWGKSKVEVLLPEQETYNRTQYDWGRTFDLAVQGIWFLELGHKINTDSIYQGKITKVSNLTPSTFQRENIPPALVTMAYERVKAIKDECDRIMSIWDLQRGGGSGVGMTKTAAGLAMTIEKANTPRQNEIGNIQDELITDIVGQWWMLNKENSVVQAQGPEGNPMFEMDEAGNTKVDASGKPIPLMIPDPLFQIPCIIEVLPAKEFGMEAIRLDRTSSFVAKWQQSPMFKQRALAVKDTIAYGFNPDELMEQEDDVDSKVQAQQIQAKYQEFLKAFSKLEAKMMQMEIQNKGLRNTLNGFTAEELNIMGKGGEVEEKPEKENEKPAEKEPVV